MIKFFDQKQTFWLKFHLLRKHQVHYRFAVFNWLLCTIHFVSAAFNVIVGGFFFGIGDAGVWTVYPTIASRYAAKHSGVGSKKEETYRNHYIGYLFASAQISVVGIIYTAKCKD